MLSYCLDLESTCSSRYRIDSQLIPCVLTALHRNSKTQPNKKSTSISKQIPIMSPENIVLPEETLNYNNHTFIHTPWHQYSQSHPRWMMINDACNRSWENPCNRMRMRMRMRLGLRLRMRMRHVLQH